MRGAVVVEPEVASGTPLLMKPRKDHIARPYSQDRALTHMELEQVLEERTQAINERDEAMANLRAAQTELESQVRARTAELIKVNQALKSEIEQRQRVEESLTFALSAARMGEWDLDLVHDTSRRSFRHDQIFGYTSPLAQWGRKSFLEHVVPEDRKAVEQEFRRAIETGEQLNVECRILWPDKSLHWIIASGRVFHDRRQKPVRMAGVVMEATQLKLAEEKLHFSDRRFRSLIENSIDAIILVSADARVLYTSPSTERILGYAPEEFMGSDSLGMVHPDDRETAVERFTGLIASPGKPVMGESRLRHKDGSWVWTESISTNLLDEPSVRAIVINFRDINLRKAAQGELESTNERLEHLSRRLLEVQETERRFIARELHDEIGQALTALKINLQEILRNPDPEARVSRTLDCVGLIDQTVLQVRNLSVELRPSILDDLGLVAALRWYLDRVAKRSSFEQHYSAEGVQSRLPSDLETACFRVAQEALTNIIRHAGAHAVYVKLVLTDGSLRLTISDDGKGFNVQESMEKAMHGASLGILGMQERVTLLGGTLNFISTAGKGTDLIADFPLK